ncbi:MAG: ABC transporter ATP-binding protein [Propionibacteriaceae bacterium]|jgi:putative ABC transport system ATP-binding protein|nr:ABC transporter ATP-binding protein [Propionibacteriaceae bacterium]
MNILNLENVSYTYDERTNVLNNIDWSFETGKLYGIVGRSGAGKTTLLSLLAGLATPTGGVVDYAGKDLSKMNRYDYRAQNAGVIFQSFNLLPHLSAVENVELAMAASGKRFSEPRKRALDLLNQVGLDEELANRRILKLSGGEQQRVAIARALAIDPQIILADEPTGNLDLETEDDIMSILTKLAHDLDKCVIVVTHSPDVAGKVDQIYELTALRSSTGKKKRR